MKGGKHYFSKGEVVSPAGKEKEVPSVSFQKGNEV